MRVGIYASSMAVRSGYENIVSGHVQVPIHTAKILIDAGHDVELITTEYGPDMGLPAMAPSKIPVHQLNGVRLPESAGGSRSNVKGMHYLQRTILSVVRLIWLARKQKYDVLHLFGASGTAVLGGIVRLAGISCPVVVTLNAGRKPNPSGPIRWLWKRIDRFLTTSEYFQSALISKGIAARLIRHGVIRDMKESDYVRRNRSRVLFWREASPLNGGDIGVEVFKRLAPKYPDITFDFAVRPHPFQPKAVAELASTMGNVNLFTTPYTAGVTLERLLSESICVLQPFRAFTIHPQLSILESMSAGVPVVATDIESARELIDSGDDGLLVPSEDYEAAAAAVELLIVNHQLASSMSLAAEKGALEKWKWDDYAENLLIYYHEAIQERA